MSIVIRPLAPDDADRLLDLASRLTEGVAPWRTPASVLSAVTSWVRDAVSGHDADHPVYVAVTLDHHVIGFVAGSVKVHWTGDRDAYVGELVVDADHARQGIGALLLRRLEEWATEGALGRIRLETGAANASALAFYEHQGFRVEDVTLTKGLPARG